MKREPREIVFHKKFTGNDDFEAVRRAESYLKERGFSVASMERGSPRGIMYGEYGIAKWRNLQDSEKQALHGVMTTDNHSMRNGAISIVIWSISPEITKAIHAESEAS